MPKYYLYVDDRSVENPMKGPFDSKGEAEELLFEYMSYGYEPANLILLEETGDEGERSLN